jgi:hypothetical protein
MLLVFDSIHFLDPVDDEGWRAELIQQMEGAGFPGFTGYRSINDALPTLIQEGAMVRRDPALLQSTNDGNVVAAALTDLQDPSWAQMAARPGEFKMPCHRDERNGAPTWEIFRPKLPDAFIAALTSVSRLRRHLVHRGRGDESWVLSYEAGSAITLSLHLAAANELGLAPVTDSQMHHALLLEKVARAGAPQETGPLPPAAIRQLANRTAITILDTLLPRHALERVSFDQILEFRSRTASLRRQCVAEIYRRLSVVNKGTSAQQFEQAATELHLSLEKDLREYRAELAAARDKLWPTFTDSLGASLPTGGVAAVAASYLGGIEFAFSAAAVAVGLALLKGLLNLKGEARRTSAGAAPPISYFSQVAERLAK